MCVLAIVPQNTEHQFPEALTRILECQDSVVVKLSQGARTLLGGDVRVLQKLRRAVERHRPRVIALAAQTMDGSDYQHAASLLRDGLRHQGVVWDGHVVLLRVTAQGWQVLGSPVVIPGVAPNAVAA